MRARMTAHINYIQYRGDEQENKLERTQSGAADLDEEAESRPEVAHRQSRIDPETGTQIKGKARPFWDQDGNRIFGRDLNRSVRLLGSGDVTHKLIISPGHNNVDMHRYTREILTELGNAKGQEFRYAYVIHENTKHKHAHVVLLGRDKDGHKVTLDKHDHFRLRAYGDRYLEREHKIERIFDQEMERFARDRGINIMFDKERGEEFYKLLNQPNSKEKQRQLEDYLHHDENWRKLFEEPQREGNQYLGRTSYHLIGRQSDLKGLMDNAQQRKLWEDVKQNKPDLRDEATQKLEQLAADRQELIDELGNRTNLGDPFKALDNISRDFQQQDRQLQAVLRGFEPGTWSWQDIDYGKLSAEERIELSNGILVTKFDTSDDLRHIQTLVWDQKIQPLSPEDFSKLWKWINQKTRDGEDCFGTPPLIERGEKNPYLDREPEWEPEPEPEPDPAFVIDHIDGIVPSCCTEEEQANDEMIARYIAERELKSNVSKQSKDESTEDISSNSDPDDAGKAEEPTTEDDYDPDWAALEVDEAGEPTTKEIEHHIQLEINSTFHDTDSSADSDEPDRSERDKPRDDHGNLL